MSDADDASARIERFAAEVDAKLRRLREELPEPPPPPPAAPSSPPVTPAPPREARPPLMIELPPEDEYVAASDDEPERHRGGRAGSVLLALVGVAIAVVVVAVSVGPTFLPYDTFAMRSSSMKPAIPRGSLVLVLETDAGDVEIGDVITFDAPDGGRRVTHRVVGRETSEGEPVFVTKGDHNAAPDPWRVRATGTQLRVRTHVDYAGYLFTALGNPIARIVLVTLSLGVLAFEIRRRRAS